MKKAPKGSDHLISSQLPSWFFSAFQERQDLDQTPDQDPKQVPAGTDPEQLHHSQGNSRCCLYTSGVYVCMPSFFISPSFPEILSCDF